MDMKIGAVQDPQHGGRIRSGPADRLAALLRTPLALAAAPLDDGPDGGRTEVTETFDWSTARFPLLLTLSPFPWRNRRGIEKSLVRLAHIATASGQ
jgi:hypothetical protein